MERLLKPPPDEFLELVAIGKGVNRVANDDAAIQAPMVVEAPAPRPKAVAKAKGGGQGSLF